MYKFIIPIGDWSDDGHGKCDEFIIECNHSVGEVRQGYKNSCKLTGISFNHNNDFTGLNRDWKEAEKYHIATDYQDSTISKEVENILIQHGINLREETEDIELSDDKIWIDGSGHFIEILMNFIKLSIKDLEYKIVKQDLPYLNGYWNSDLNVQFGYGLFD